MLSKFMKKLVDATSPVKEVTSTIKGKKLPMIAFGKHVTLTVRRVASTTKEIPHDNAVNKVLDDICRESANEFKKNESAIIHNLNEYAKLNYDDNIKDFKPITSYKDLLSRGAEIDTDVVVDIGHGITMTIYVYCGSDDFDMGDAAGVTFHGTKLSPQLSYK